MGPAAVIRVVCWKWYRPGYRSKFSAEHVNILRNMIERNTTVPYEVVCITDDPRGIDPRVRVIPLWPNPAPAYGALNRPNCFVRLRAFAPEMVELIGPRFLWLDLDTVITGNIDHVLNDQADFKIWRLVGEKMPCNGSMVLHRAGTRSELWSKFNPNEVDPRLGFQRKTGFLGSDQAWIASQLRADDEYFGKEHGVYSYRCHLEGRPLPSTARIVFFHGNYDPSSHRLMSRHRWIRENYC